MRAAIEIERILHAEGVIARRDHPELHTALDWLLRRGLIRAVLPGVYAWADRVDTFETRVAAVAAAGPDAVIIGPAAARLSFWSTLSASRVDVAARRPRCRTGPISICRRDIPLDLIAERHGVRLTSPALTALDLAVPTQGGSIDRVLFKRRATLEELHRAMDLTRGRAGNPERRQLLLDSRDEPWSYPERLAHQELRAAGLTGWQANYPVHLFGATYYLDIAFEKLRLAIEIDGREHHGPQEFEHDRWRQNDIIFDGWHLLRFAADVILRRDGSFVRQVERAIESWGS